MTFTTSKSKVRTIKQGDKGWLMRDGFSVSGRAGIEVSVGCPYAYKLVLHECIQQGWVKPVANVYEHELMWDNLTERN